MSFSFSTVEKGNCSHSTRSDLLPAVVVNDISVSLEKLFLFTNFLKVNLKSCKEHTINYMKNGMTPSFLNEVYFKKSRDTMKYKMCSSIPFTYESWFNSKKHLYLHRNELLLLYSSLSLNPKNSIF
jgi:hypothetical protein